MAKQQNWNMEEIQILKENYLTTSKEEILKLLPNRNWQGVLHKTSRLRLIGRSNINKKRGNNAKQKINIDFFKQIGDNQAYILGRLITDGSWRLRKTGGICL